MNDFSNLVILVTGGASGIGNTTALHFASLGGTVAVLDITTEGLDPSLHGYSCDIRVRTQVNSTVEQIAADLGGIDIVVNNAGVSAIGTVEGNDDEEWARVLDINVTGMARVSAAALPYLRASKAAAIVNLCSIAATAGLPQRALYSATKGAVGALTLAMAADHVSEGIRVNCVNPGTVATPFVDRMLQKFPDPQAERAALNARQATGRMVEPLEVARAIAYLAHPANGSTTGMALAVDGGMGGLRVRPVQKV
ncbi:SDR family oxidoreductase [Micrococcales bacterium 31B]|nr:SDR family oxidoreductase [Micrococcales bacterium 31B]